MKIRGVALVTALLVSMLPAAASSAIRPSKPKAAPLPTAPPQLYISPTGSDAGPCSEAKPCASFQKAFSVAQPGATVQVADGYYGNCSSPITGVKSDFVTFVPAPGAHPWTTCPLSLQAEHIRFRDMKLDGLYLGGSYVTLDHVDVTCLDQPPFKLYGPSIIAPNSPGPVSPTGYYCSAFLKGTPQHFRMIGGSVGPTYLDGCVGSDDSSIGYSAPSYVATDLLFDGIVAHSARFRGASGCSTGVAHTETFYFTAVRDVTIKNSRFYDGGSSADIFITDQNQGLRSQDITIENNVFDRSTNMAINASYVDGLKVAYNTFPFGIGWIADGANISFVGNLGYVNMCPAPYGLATYSHDVWYFDNSTGGSASKCGPTDTTFNANSATMYADASPYGDFRLRAGSPAIGRGDPQDRPLRDRFGTCRMNVKAPDAGAFQLSQPRALKPTKGHGTKKQRKSAVVSPGCRPQ